MFSQECLLQFHKAPLDLLHLLGLHSVMEEGPLQHHIFHCQTIRVRLQVQRAFVSLGKREVKHAVAGCITSISSHICGMQKTITRRTKKGSAAMSIGAYMQYFAGVYTKMWPEGSVCGERFWKGDAGAAHTCRWSYSCWKMRACQSVKVSISVSPFTLWALTFTRCGLCSAMQCSLSGHYSWQSRVQRSLNADPDQW